MKNAAFSIEELFRFLDAGVSAFHSTACLLYTSDAADD